MFTHLENLLKTGKYSDFTIVDKNAECLRLHKCILSENTFFEAYFNKHDNDESKSSYYVENIQAAKILIEYIYRNTYEFRSLGKLSVADLVDLKTLARLWNFSDEFDQIVDQHILETWKIRILENFGIIPQICHHFDEIFRDYRGESLIVEFMVKHKAWLTLDLIRWEISRELPTEVIAEICIKNSAFDELYKINDCSKYVAKYIKIYHAESQIFTKEQLHYINQYNVAFGEHEIVNSFFPQNYIVIKKFVPFSAIVYAFIGNMDGDKSEKICIALDTETSIKTNDILFFSHASHTISSILYDGNSLDVGKIMEFKFSEPCTIYSTDEPVWKVDIL